MMRLGLKSHHPVVSRLFYHAYIEGLATRLSFQYISFFRVFETRRNNKMSEKRKQDPILNRADEVSNVLFLLKQIVK
jgi:hypothetical protein